MSACAILRCPSQTDVLLLGTRRRRRRRRRRVRRSGHNKEKVMRAVRYLVPGCLIVVSLAAPLQAFAQEGTPEADLTLPRCTVEPRDADETIALWFDASGNPAATPTAVPPIDAETLLEGAPVDDETVTAITDLTEQWLSCMEVAQQYLRGFALVTDKLLAQFGPDLTNPEQDTPDEVR